MPRSSPQSPVDWGSLTRLLLARVHGTEREDIVQETILKVLLRLGPRPAAEDALRLSWCTVRSVRVDFFRKTLREPTPLLVEPQSRSDEPRQSLETELIEMPTALRLLLGARAMRLLDTILAGCRTNKALARCLDSDPSSVRQRRRRIARVLSCYLRTRNHPS